METMTSMPRRMLAFAQVPIRHMALIALASCGAIALAVFIGWPIWAAAVAAIVPWLTVFQRETAWIYRHYRWLALYYVLVVIQVGHFGEHVCQMLQIHLLHRTGPDARGIIGVLDVEWVHFIFNSWIILTVLVMVPVFRANRWLWATLLIAGWHEIEHLYIMSVYLRTGIAGTPGLLSRGGAIHGGLPITRADLHFFYNLIETIPLVIGFVWQLAQLQRAVTRASVATGETDGAQGEARVAEAAI